MDPSIVFCTQFNGTAADGSASAAVADDWSETPYASASIEVADKKFGSGSLKLLVADWVLGGRPSTAETGVDWVYGSSLSLNEYTFHAWVKFPVCPGVYASIVEFEFLSEMVYDGPPVTDIRGYNAHLNYGAFQLALSDNANTVDFNWLYDMDIWHHIAVTKVDGFQYSFFDGVLLDTRVVAVGPYVRSYEGVYLQCDSIWNDVWYDGAYIHFYPANSAVVLIDEMILSSTALWTETFTPPTVELGASSSQVGVTKLLLHMNQ